ncbi:hypothetical protein F4604DRAFT_1748333 [Suillus subluteus]|nr:hypothetical protein F4604DRAFT_1748333 [Suillus subluteus]
MSNFGTEHSNLENNPPILKLPFEILDYCWGYLRRRDLFQVSRVSRIFQSLTVTLPSPGMLPPSQNLDLLKMLERAATRITGFYSDPSASELWDMVQDWTIATAPAIRSNIRYFVRSQEKNLATRSCSPNLRSLELVRMNLGRQQWIIIESLPVLETLRLISCLFPPSSHLERPLKLKEACNRWRQLRIFVTSPSGDHFSRFLSAIPALATLRIFPWSANITPPHPLPALSFLRSYDGYPNLLSVHRAWTTSRLCYAIHSDLVSTVRDISLSAVPVRKLAIEYFLPTLDNLAAIAKHLPHLHHLDLGLISGPPPLTPEEIIALSESSSEFSFNHAGEPLDTVDTIQGLLSWLAEGRAPLPPKLVTLRLSHSSTENEDVQCVESIKQLELVTCLQSRYPRLCEVEMGGCRWWREGVHWSREIT